MLPILLLIVCFHLSQPLSVFAMCYRYDCCYTASLGIEFSFTGTEILGIGYALPIYMIFRLPVQKFAASVMRYRYRC